jgi:hypothetical protein
MTAMPHRSITVIVAVLLFFLQATPSCGLVTPALHVLIAALEVSVHRGGTVIQGRLRMVSEHAPLRDALLKS